MKLVELNTIFDIKYGNQFDLYKLETDEWSDVNFVSRSSQNLGVVAKVSRYNDVEPFPAGLITVTLGGTYLLSSFIQQDVFYTAQNIKVLKPKKVMSMNEKLFYCKAIEANRFRYTSHGREANITLDTLLVPYQVPKEFLEIEIDKLSVLNGKSILNENIHVNANKWESFPLTVLFNLKGTKTTPILELVATGKGEYPFVTTQATNNGIEGFYDLETEEGNVLTIDSAVLGYCAYQEINFSASDHVEKLIPKFKLNKYIAMFLVTIINQEQYRYNYGRKCSQTRMKEISIKLPSKNNKPDLEFMEKYIKALPYSSSL